MIGVIKNSRTIEEQYGVGIREEQARAQVTADLITRLFEGK